MVFSKAEGMVRRVRPARATGVSGLVSLQCHSRKTTCEQSEALGYWLAWHLYVQLLHLALCIFKGHTHLSGLFCLLRYGQG